LTKTKRNGTIQNEIKPILTKKNFGEINTRQKLNEKNRLVSFKRRKVHCFPGYI
jgi:hypothetical protein